MTEINILTNKDLRDAVKLNLEAIDCIEAGFHALATQPIIMPPIMRLDIPEYNGEVDVKTAYIPGVDSFAIKMSPGFFDNPKLGLPSVNGLMVLFSAKTGLVEALLLDNGYLTDVRTAAAGGVAAKWLSRKDAKHAGIVGAGVQGFMQLQALRLVRDIKTVSVWARDPNKAEDYARRVRDEMGLTCTVADKPDLLAETSDIIVTTTPATEPLLGPECLRPGLHITAMGSDAEHKNELAPELTARADLYVPDHTDQCRRLGELHHAIDKGLIAAETPQIQLGEVIAGLKPGRISEDQITIADLTGTGMQDTAIATLARQVSEKANAGQIIRS
ncbi:cyclodeaminase [Aestuariispira insulae]|uniref:Ornithine cyclodeaminase n=1 Tax=Aestuariispira insulae TaxID=1461337 RepID=A0A3D9H1L0_9PROT|nr:cyclodeaminase [Aestuariispira insulae]RED43393.1 ornithine cyclodeaminase [Aestuariispira insulae]